MSRVRQVLSALLECSQHFLSAVLLNRAQKKLFYLFYYIERELKKTKIMRETIKQTRKMMPSNCVLFSEGAQVSANQSMRSGMTI
jgi:hypothetical protein